MSLKNKPIEELSEDIEILKDPSLKNKIENDIKKQTKKSKKTKFKDKNIKKFNRDGK